MKKYLFIVLAAGCTKLSIAQTDSTKHHADLQELVVRSIQTDPKKPVVFSTLNAKDVKKIYYGADMPSLLLLTPSVNAYSDNGTGIGYSYFRLRGMDQTRINTTINGIPVNDPENQGVFFNNFADLASSAQLIQVQRGIGTSTNGTSAFGGSVNIQTRNLNNNPSAGVYFGMGSFGSTRKTAEIQSGLMGKHWLFYARMGQVSTNGYKENSGSKVQSYQFSLGYSKGNSYLKFNFFGGNAQNELSYLGTDKETFQKNPKSNPFVRGESDAFNQYFNQVQYSLKVNAHNSFSASAYLVNGNAPKFEYLFPKDYESFLGFKYFNMGPEVYYLNGTDTMYTGEVMSSYRLNQTMYGGFANWQYQTNKLDILGAVHANHFESNHFMEVLWANYMPAGLRGGHKVYDNTGTKTEQSMSLKVNYRFSNNFSAFVDMQGRFTQFSYASVNMQYRPNDGVVSPMSWTFFNPRIGARYAVSDAGALFGFVGMSRREPTRFDYFQDDFAPRDIQQSEIKPEEVLDFELGYTFQQAKLNYTLNVYAMEFSNQIVGTGAFNNFGYPVTGNIGKSYRRGFEADVKGRVNKHLAYGINLNASINKAKAFNQTFYNNDSARDEVQHFENKSLALSPGLIAQAYVSTSWINERLSADVMGRYVSKQYLDNTESYFLESFSVFDMLFSWNFTHVHNVMKPVLSFRINNVANVSYAPSGSIGGSGTITNGKRDQYELYLASARRNYFLTLSLNF